MEELKPYFAQINSEAQIEVDAVDIFEACNKTLEIYRRDYWVKKNILVEEPGTSISFRIWSQYGDAAM